MGEAFKTYILAERGDELCLIDKHAAHERQLYEKLAASYGNVPGQLLLEPAAIDLSAEEKQALLDNIPLLENAGLEIADFGGNTVVPSKRGISPRRRSCWRWPKRSFPARCRPSARTDAPAY